MLLNIINVEILKELGVILFKVVLCVILVGSIGYNREKKGMVVGIRTHVLVGLVGLLIQLTSLEYYKVNGGTNDVFRLAGQYISGIGFLGAGTILKDKRSVKGLTTAASICLAACIGLAVGSGVYMSAIIVTLVAYIFLTDLFRLKKRMAIMRSNITHIEVSIVGDLELSISRIKELIINYGIDISGIEVVQISNEKSKIILKLTLDDEIDVNEILSELISLKEVVKTEIIK